MNRKAKVEAESKKQPASLGKKRSCPKCGAKFYDFEKPEGDCPKCQHHINFKQMDEMSLLSPAPIPKKAPKPKVVEEEETSDTLAPASGEELESVEDLNDGDESLEDLKVKEGEEDEEEDY